MKRLNGESGQALIVSALCMTCLIGFVALAADVGIMLREKRLLQIAADSAAIAGALEINYDTGAVTSAALAAAQQNGFTAITSGTTTSAGVTVTVNGPPGGPVNGPHAGDPNYVEVIVSQKQSTFFMNVFGFASMTPTVRAVAQNGASSYGCVYALSPTGDPKGGWGIDLQGSFTLNTPNCGVIDDTATSNALNFTGNAGIVDAGSVGVVGGVSGSPKNPFTPITGIVAQSDPLLGTLPAPPDPTKLTCSAPTAASSSAGSAGKLSGNVIVPAGVYTMCYSGTVNVAGANFPAGTYVFTGDVNVSGTVTTAQPPPPVPPSTVSANPLNGTTIDIDSGTLSTATGTTWGLYAPQAASTTYTNYNGIALMQPKSNSNTMSIQSGNAFGKIDGIIYAPTAQLFMNDSGGDKSSGITLITDLVVGTLEDKTATLNITSYSQSTSGSPLTKVVLVE
jgi:Flp pilus assembly protein TadG